MKRGKRLGGKGPQRGGRLSRPFESRSARADSNQLLPVLMIAFLILGVAGGFGWGMDRQVRGGILQQRVEAIQRPDWVPLNTLPAYIPRAFLAVVDPYFEMGGQHGRGNGSTLPRELVRQVHLLGSGVAGEARALFMAPVLEQHATPTEILEMYLNRVPLGESRDYPIYGLYFAATEYFGKEPRELSLSEAATLAGMLLQPNIERPAERPGAAGIRRNEVLRVLLAREEISENDYAAAIAEPLGFQPGIREIPMSRRMPAAADTSVIRLPLQYRPTLPEEDPSE